jgi:hypothetical protein
MAVIITPGDANPVDVRGGKRFNAGANYYAEGTRTDRAGTGLTVTPSASDQAIPEGVYDGNAGDGKVSAVSFNAAKVLADTTIAGTQGTMVDRTGDTAAASITRSGTTIKLKATEGYRDGVNDNVTHIDANDVAANIRKDITIRGLTGTYNALYVTAGDNLFGIIELITYNSTTSYVEKLYGVVGVGGIIRTEFDLYTDEEDITAFGRIYVNGVARGIERECAGESPDKLTFTEDISGIEPGDRISLYLRSGSAGVLARTTHLKLSTTEIVIQMGS